MEQHPEEQESFEDLLREFDEAVSSLESDELSLEFALSRYESAVELAGRCAQLLQNAELRIREIDRSIESLERVSES